MNRHHITMDHPASWHGELWREALFLGNGLSGILMNGAIADETIRCNRYNLWHGGIPGGEIPDVSDAFRVMREKILAGAYADANKNCIAAALHEKGYTSAPQVPHPLGSLRITTEPETIFKNYKRCIDMRTAEGFVSYDIGKNHYRRRVFVSREWDLVVLSMEADSPFTASYRFELFEADGRKGVTELSAAGIAARVTDGAYGANIRFAGDYTAEVRNNRVYVTGKRYLVFLQLWSETEPEFPTEVCIRTYEELLARHTALYTPLYESVSLELADEEVHASSMENGVAKGLVFPEGTVDLHWDKNGMTAEIRAEKPFTAAVFVKGKPVREISPDAGETVQISVN